VGRMEDPESEAGTTPEFEIPADFRLAHYAAREPWELGDDAPIPAVVRFDFPLSLWAERNGKGERVETLTGGAELRRFRVRQADPFLRWLQQFGGDARVVDPPELRQAQRRMARETLAVYGPEDGDA
jgi:predicted DNA-binding transcriptional regulator YafY